MHRFSQVIYKKDKIVITGGTGFLGQAVVKELEARGYENIWPINSKDFDLTIQRHSEVMYQTHEPDVVLHLAARVGGIGANKQNPGKFIHDNLAMGINLIESGRQNNLKKFVMVGTVCAYPKFTPVPFKEEDIWEGYPEETNAPYGIAKKALMQMIISYREQYGFNGINLIPVNMYGPLDNFDPRSSHVIPALILKFHEAMKNTPHKPVEIWGTGQASREFLYVNDCAQAIVRAMERLNDPQPINIGTGEEIKISDLVEKISNEMGYQGQIKYNSKYPDGQPRRCLDTTKAKQTFGFSAKTSFDDGLRQTIDWFERKT